MTFLRRADLARGIAVISLAGFLTALAAGSTAGALPLPSSLSIDFSSAGYSVGAGAPASQNGWSVAKAGVDLALVDNASFPAAGLPAGRSFRMSNATSPSSSSHISAPHIAPAGEPGTNALVNTFDVSFTVASATGAVQPGLGVDVNIDDASRYGGLVNLRHTAAGLEIGSFWVPSTVTASPVNSDWRSKVFATVPANVPHTIRVVTMYLQGQPDLFDVYVDGVLVSEGSGATTWENYTRLTATGGDHSVDGISFKTSSSAPSTDGIGYTTLPAAPATSGNGFLFSNISYSTRMDSPPVETVPPVLAPAPDPAPDATIEVDQQPLVAGESIEFATEGFLPFEDVYVTVYSTPVFAGWLQADANGRVSGSVAVPAGLEAGTHTLQLTGAVSGFVVQSAFQVSALAATGGQLEPAVVGGASALVVLGLALAVVARHRRVRV